MKSCNRHIEFLRSTHKACFQRISGIKNGNCYKEKQRVLALIQRSRRREKIIAFKQFGFSEYFNSSIWKVIRER
jgi:hypothetical protein